jgi:uncharacterized repeat protein (TIGR03917 family)
MLGFIAALDEDRLRAVQARKGSIGSADLYQELLATWLDFEEKRAQPGGAAPALTADQRWTAVTALALLLWASTNRLISLAELAGATATATALTTLAPSSARACVGKTRQERILMSIVPPPRSPLHPAPRELRPIAGARGVGDGYFEIAVQPGADAADVAAALGAIPLEAAYVEVHDDVDTVLVFRVAPPAAAPVPARPAGPDAPARPALVAAA